MAGLLFAPAVDFTTITIQEQPAAPTGLTGTTQESKRAGQPTSQATAVTASKATPKSTSAKTASAKFPTLQSRTEEAAQRPSSDVSKLGSSLSSGILKNIFGTGTSVSNLASNGGSVLAGTLDETTVRNNSFRGLTIAVLVLGESGDLDLSSNQVLTCEAGFWLINLTQAQYLLRAAQNQTIIGAAIAMGYPLPQGDTSSSDMVTISAAPNSIRIYAGSSDYTDSNSNVWTPDASATGVTISTSPLTGTYTTTASINGTEDPALYQSERAGTSFSYTFTNLPAGFYTVTLKFAEIFYQQAQKRAFNVSINGNQVLTEFDIVADVGSPDTADDKTFANIPATGGEIVIQFTGTDLYSDQNAKIDATEIDPQWSGNPSLGSSESELLNFYDQLVQVAQQAYATLDFSAAQLRIDNNEMHYLGGGALFILDDDSLYNQNSGSLMMIGNRLDNLAGDLYFVADQAARDTAKTNLSGKLDLTRAQKKTASTRTNTKTAVKPKLAAQRGTAAAAQNKLSMPARNTIFPQDLSIVTGNEFTYLVEILQVSRCVVTSNMLTTGTIEDDFGACFVLDDFPVQQAELAVMSNVFTGRVLINPQRDLSYASNLPYDVTTWAFLNTIIG